MFKFLLHDYMLSITDDRARPYLHARHGLVPCMVTALAYLAFCTWLGPRFMAKRAAMDWLKPLIFGYNALMCVTNLVFFMAHFRVFSLRGDMLNFEAPAKDDYSPAALTVVAIQNAYLWTKYLDLFDTIFFVLRKKWRNISFLHLYHHASVILFGSICFPIYPTARALALYCMFNSFVHVIMYAYYFLAAMGPAVQKHLWWKRYLTQLQLVQFASYFVHWTVLVILQRGYHWLYLAIIATQAPIYLYLFGKFYVNSYRKKVNGSNGIAIANDSKMNLKKTTDFNNNSGREKLDKSSSLYVNGKSNGVKID